MLSGMQLQNYCDNGYIVVENLVNEDILDRVEHSYHLRLAQLEEALHIDTQYKQFKDRMFHVYECSGTTHNQFFNISLPLNGVTEDTPYFFPDSIFQLLTYPQIVSIAQQLLKGEEVMLNPVQYARMKPPIGYLPQADINNVLASQVDWHQDSAELMPIAQIYTRFVTVWLALHDVNESDGCLMFLPGSNGRGINLHCRTPWNTICLKRPIHENYVHEVPIKRGSVIFYDGLTLHSSCANKGSLIRQSFDFRYQLADQPTGRDIFPSFLVRSTQGKKILSHADEWRSTWQYYHRKLAKMNLHKNFYTWWPETKE